MPEYRFPFITIIQNNKEMMITRLPAGLVTRISYAAVRGLSNEPGAVQRILSKRRINSIKKFTIEVGDFPGSIILNWVSQDNPLRREDNEIVFRDEVDSAQIIDGQHRIAGIRAAIEEREEIRDLQLPVSIYEHLS